MNYQARWYCTRRNFGCGSTDRFSSRRVVCVLIPPVFPVLFFDKASISASSSIFAAILARFLASFLTFLLSDNLTNSDAKASLSRELTCTPHMVTTDRGDGYYFKQSDSTWFTPVAALPVSVSGTSSRKPRSCVSAIPGLQNHLSGLHVVEKHLCCWSFH